MRSFKQLSIRTKVSVILLLGVCASQFIALINFISYDRYSIKENIREELDVLAAITAQRSSAALAFGDSRAAQANLNVLSIRSNIRSACIYQQGGELFVAYNRDSGALSRCADNVVYSDVLTDDRYIAVMHKIENKSQLLGHILITSDLSPLHRKITIWIILSFAFLLLASTIAWIMMRRMQRYVIRPLQHLTGVMREVKEGNDLSLRASSSTEDEFGQLIRTFNDMLGIIENGNDNYEVLYQELIKRSTEAEASALKLEAKNQDIKTFFSGAAHDLRQPLQAMAIFTDMLELQPENKSSDLLVKLKASLENLQSMFTEILDADRFEHESGAMANQPTNLGALLDKLTLEFSILAQNDNLSLRTRIKPFVINTIPGMLERVIRNLVSNAIRYTDSGGILIALRQRQHALWLEVWDTGRGLKKDTQTNIFKKFEKVSGEAQAPGAYGLGLALVENFIGILGFEIEVHSVHGRGSCFRIVIPTTAIQALPSRNQYIEDKGKDSEESTTEKKTTREENTYDTPVAGLHLAVESPKDGSQNLDVEFETLVVLVDDDAAIRSALKQGLQAVGIRVMDFDGLDGVRGYFSRDDYSDPDFIISDYQLANNVLGDSVIDLVRDMTGIDIPALVITGCTDESLLQRLDARQMEYLKKPVALLRLCERIAHYTGE